MCVPCGHTFCGSCISTLRSNSELERCAMCRERISSIVRNRFAENLMEDVEGTCRLCGQVFPLSGTEDHIGTCEMVQITCGRCSASFPRREEASHQGQCAMALVHCECGEEFVRRDLAMHKASACGHILVACPLACGESVKRYVSFAYRMLFIHLFLFLRRLLRIFLINM